MLHTRQILHARLEKARREVAALERALAAYGEVEDAQYEESSISRGGVYRSAIVTALKSIAKPATASEIWERIVKADIRKRDGSLCNRTHLLHVLYTKAGTFEWKRIGDKPFKVTLV